MFLPAFILSLALTSVPANSAEQPSHQKLVYEVYAGGIHALQATLDMEIKSKDRYSLSLFAKTRGLLGSLAPWFGTFESHGWVLGDGVFRPQQHKSTATWREETEIKDYAYGKDGKFLKITVQEDGKDPEIRDIEKEITDDTTDALTAALLILENYNKTGTCEGTSKVFDGNRSFDQKFVHQENVELQASKYNIYEGPAAECTVEVVPLKGKWHEKPRGWLSIQEQGRERGLMPTMWVANLDKNAPAVPVKIRVKTAYGTLFMHLAEYQNDGKIIVAEKRVLDEEE